MPIFIYHTGHHRQPKQVNIFFVYNEEGCEDINYFRAFNDDVEQNNKNKIKYAPN